MLKKISALLASGLALATILALTTPRAAFAGWCEDNCPEDPPLQCCGLAENGHYCGPSACAPTQNSLFESVWLTGATGELPKDVSGDIKAKRHIQVELQDADTSLVQDVDFEAAHLQVTVQEGNTYQVFSFTDQFQPGGSSERSQEKDLEECEALAAQSCGTGNVSSVSYERHIFWSCCSWTCFSAQE